MAEVRAFRGFRYDLGHVGTLSDVVAPPYDVISPALQQQLAQRSPYNVIRLELPTEVPDDTDTHNKYTRAANTLREWIAAGIVRQDTARSLYLYEQEFESEGITHTRRGFLGRVRLEPFGTGKVFPHEQTFSGPKEDRLKLYRATGFNISPIFSLYPDPEGEVARVFEPFVHTSPPLVAKDHLGVTSRLWVVTDSHAISTITGIMGSKPLYIADGHHRYETALKYLEERRAVGEVRDDESPANFTLMLLVAMSDPGLVIQPTHRLLSGMSPLNSQALEQLIRQHFAIVERSGTDAKAAWEFIQMDGTQSLLGFGTASDKEWFVARLRDEKVMAELVPNHSPQWRGLAISVLHNLVIGRLFDGKPTCRYVHLLDEAREALHVQDCQVAVLVPPVTMQHVEELCRLGEKMPQKSTYFYPKVLTGLVFNSLKKD
jgi:uncharacterized protein (DUF1015 family)